MLRARLSLQTGGGRGRGMEARNGRTGAFSILILRLPPRRCPPPTFLPRTAPRSPQPLHPCPAARLMPATPHPSRLQIDPSRSPGSALPLPSLRGPSSAGSSHWKGRRWEAKAAPPLTPCSLRFNHLQRA